MSPTRVSASLQAVERTMRAAELLADAPTGLTVAELARELGSDNSVASRVLSSLHALGYVVREETTDRYQLSLKFAAVAFRYTDRLGFPSVCLPVLHRLTDETGELTQLAAVDRERIVYVANAPGKQRLTIVPTIGREASLHATATGKAWLAYFDDERALALALAKGLDPITPNTLTTVGALLQELATVRAQGYAVSHGEFTDGVTGIASQIGMERFGRVVGTIVLSGPSYRMDEIVPDLAPLVQDAARELEAGWPSHLARFAADAAV